MKPHVTAILVPTLFLAPGLCAAPPAHAGPEWAGVAADDPATGRDPPMGAIGFPNVPFPGDAEAESPPPEGTALQSEPALDEAAPASDEGTLGLYFREFRERYAELPTMEELRVRMEGMRTGFEYQWLPLRLASDFQLIPTDVNADFVLIPTEWSVVFQPIPLYMPGDVTVTWYSGSELIDDWSDEWTEWPSIEFTPGE